MILLPALRTPYVHEKPVATWRNRTHKKQAAYTPEFHRRNAARKWATVEKLEPRFDAITDDLRDYSGNPGITGKNSGLDRDKTTFVDLCGIDGARMLVDELIDAAAGALAPLGRRSALLVAMAERVRSRDR